MDCGIQTPQHYQGNGTFMKIPVYMLICYQCGIRHGCYCLTADLSAYNHHKHLRKCSYEWLPYEIIYFSCAECTNITLHERKVLLTSRSILFNKSWTFPSQYRLRQPIQLTLLADALFSHPTWMTAIVMKTADILCYWNLPSGECTHRSAVYIMPTRIHSLV